MPEVRRRIVEYPRRSRSAEGRRLNSSASSFAPRQVPEAMAIHEATNSSQEERGFERGDGVGQTHRSAWRSNKTIELNENLVHSTARLTYTTCGKGTKLSRIRSAERYGKRHGFAQAGGHYVAWLNQGGPARRRRR